MVIVTLMISAKLVYAYLDGKGEGFVDTTAQRVARRDKLVWVVTGK